MNSKVDLFSLKIALSSKNWDTAHKPYMNTEMFDTQHLQAKARLVNYKIVVLRVEETTIESQKSCR